MVIKHSCNIQNNKTEKNSYQQFMAGQEQNKCNKNELPLIYGWKRPTIVSCNFKGE